MNVAEFSNVFDTVLDSYKSQAIFGESYNKADLVFDEYEKSVFLTQAQNIIVEEIAQQQIIPNNNSIYKKVDLSSLIDVANSEDDDGVLKELDDPESHYDDRGVMYKLPANILLMLNEKIIDDNDKQYVVIPLSFNEYDRCMSKAYNQPLKRQCWRLYRSAGSKYDSLSEIVPIKGITIKNYRIRYIRKPLPIILVDLSKVMANNALSIDGINTVSECELNPDLHIRIVYKAVELALSSKGVNTQKQKQ